MSHGGDDEIHEEHEEHVNHEAWVIPYADLLTLLMAMFIALFAMSTVDVTKFKAFAIGFNEALGGGKLDAGVGGTRNATATDVGTGSGNGPLTGGTIQSGKGLPSSNQLQQMLDLINSNKAQGASQRQTLEDLQKEIDNAAKGLGLAGEIRTKQLNNGLQVTLLTDQVLFESGRAQLQPEGLRLLHLVGGLLKTVDNTVDINGFTDNVPIGPGGPFRSNRDLSSSRANAVADYFDSLGIADSRLFPAGRGAQDFIATNATAEGRAQNRRVEIVVESKLVKATLDQAGLNDKPATPSTLPIGNGLPNAATPSIKPDLAGN